MVVLQDAVDLGHAIAGEISFIRGFLYTTGLLVDAVVATDEGVVAKGHVRGFDGERVILNRVGISELRLGTKIGKSRNYWH